MEPGPSGIDSGGGGSGHDDPHTSSARLSLTPSGISRSSPLSPFPYGSPLLKSSVITDPQSSATFNRTQFSGSPGQKLLLGTSLSAASRRSTYSPLLGGSRAMDKTALPPSFLLNGDVGNSSGRQNAGSLTPRLKATELYGGPVMFGGAGQRRQRLISSTPYGAGLSSRMRERQRFRTFQTASSLNTTLDTASSEGPPSQIEVHPSGSLLDASASTSTSPSAATAVDAMSSTARLILETLDKMSTPLQDAKKMPVARAEKRKAVEDELNLSLGQPPSSRRRRMRFGSASSSPASVGVASFSTGLNGPPLRKNFSPVPLPQAGITQTMKTGKDRALLLLASKTGADRPATTTTSCTLTPPTTAASTSAVTFSTSTATPSVTAASSGPGLDHHRFTAASIGGGKIKSTKAAERRAGAAGECVFKSSDSAKEAPPADLLSAFDGSIPRLSMGAAAGGTFKPFAGFEPGSNGGTVDKNVAVASGAFAFGKKNAEGEDAKGKSTPVVPFTCDSVRSEPQASITTTKTLAAAANRPLPNKEDGGSSFLLPGPKSATTPASSAAPVSHSSSSSLGSGGSRTGCFFNSSSSMSAATSTPQPGGKVTASAGNKTPCDVDSKVVFTFSVPKVVAASAASNDRLAASATFSFAVPEIVDRQGTTTSPRTPASPVTNASSGCDRLSKSAAGSSSTLSGSTNTLSGLSPLASGSTSAAMFKSSGSSLAESSTSVKTIGSLGGSFGSFNSSSSTLMAGSTRLDSNFNSGSTMMPDVTNHNLFKFNNKGGVKPNSRQLPDLTATTGLFSGAPAKELRTGSVMDILGKKP